MTTERDLGVALSGGGHRATVFGLGALLALVDSGASHDLVSVSSVSGGSIANGVAMIGPDLGTVGPAEFEAHVAPRLAAIAERGVLLGGAPATRGYLRALIAALGITIVALVVTIVAIVGHWWLVAVGAAVLTAAAGFVATRLIGQRSERTERAIDAELLDGSGRSLRTLGSPGSSVHHVICTTDLQTGTSLYFTDRATYGYDVCQVAPPLDVPLSLAVQASACVPGAFGPRVIHTTVNGVRTPISAVVDGGVYDNMADEWEYGFKNRSGNWPGLAGVQPQGARALVVVNASAGWDDPKPVPFRGLGLELAGLLRSKDVQYDVSTSHRRRALVREFMASDPSTRLDDGVFVQITASPYDHPSRFAATDGHTPDAKALRADEATRFLDRHGYDPTWWRATAKANAGVATTLAKLGVDCTALLLEHAYVLTTVNLYVVLGRGSLPTDFDRSRFRRLASGG